MKVRAVVLSLVVLSACTGGEAATAVAPAATTTTPGASTTAAVSSTTVPVASTAPTTTVPAATTTVAPTTTTTTLPPPPVVGFDEVVVLAERPPIFLVEQGDATSFDIHDTFARGATVEVLGAHDTAGPWRTQGFVQTRDHFTDTLAWASTVDGVWAEVSRPTMAGGTDEIAAAVVTDGEIVIAVGNSRRSGTRIETVGGVDVTMSFPWDGAVWRREGDGPWDRVADPDLGGDRDEEMLDVVTGGPGWVAVGTSSIFEFPRFDFDAAVWVSADGLAWERVADPAGVFSGPGYQTMSVVTAFGGVLYAFGESTTSTGSFTSNDLAAWRSTDGLTWEAVDGGNAFDGGSLTPHDAAVMDGVLVVVGSDAGAQTHDPVVWRTVDGATWERIGLPPGKGELQSVAEVAGGFVAVGGTFDGSPLAFASYDGAVWEPIVDAALDGAFLFQSVVSFDGSVVVAGKVIQSDGGMLGAWRGEIGRPPTPPGEVTGDDDVPDSDAPDLDATALFADLEAAVEDVLEHSERATTACGALADALIAGTEPDGDVLNACFDGRFAAELALNQAEILVETIEQGAPGRASEARLLYADAEAAFAEAEEALGSFGG